jgi:KaiC/GvpD/RAD55 family RecA-like ATPase
MHDFNCKDSKDFYYPELAKGVRHFKEKEGGRKIMCDAVKRYAEKYAENMMADERSGTVKRMLKKGKTTEEIADLCGYDLKFVQSVEESMTQKV